MKPGLVYALTFGSNVVLGSVALSQETLLARVDSPAPVKAASIESRVAHYAGTNRIPNSVAHAVIMLESRYRASAVNRGNYGLMQIRHATARAMGYRGDARGLLNAETNLQYGMKYLARGWHGSGGDLCRTIAHYQTGRLVRSVPASSHAYCSRARQIIAKR